MKDKMYTYIESDLHNIQPAIGEINGDRSNFMYSELNNSISKYGQCQVKIDFKKKLIEPPKRARGPIARTYFYMHQKYNIVLSKNQKRLFEIWDRTFPVTFWECKREQLIFSVQGNHNYYVYKKCFNSK